MRDVQPGDVIRVGGQQATVVRVDQIGNLTLATVRYAMGELGQVRVK